MARTPRAPKAPNTAAAAPERKSPSVAGVAVAILFGLLYAYDVYEAIGSWVAVASAFGEQGLALPVNLVLLFLAATVLPVVVFTVAMWIGWRQRWWQIALLLLAGWATSNALFLTLAALVSGPPA